MTTPASRALSALILIAAFLAVGMVIRPDWIGGPQAAASGVTTFVSGPDEQVKLLTRRCRARAWLADELLAGERSLLETAAAFRVVNDYPAAVKDEHWRALPGGSDGEKLCRQVLGHVATRPGVTEGQLAELERELADHLARHGTVTLPADN